MYYDHIKFLQQHICKAIQMDYGTLVQYYYIPSASYDERTELREDRVDG